MTLGGCRDSRPGVISIVRFSTYWTRCALPEKINGQSAVSMVESSQYIRREALFMQGELPSQRITEGVIWKQLLFFFFPILLGSFFQQMYNTVDTIIVGRFVGTRALAAVGSTSALLNLMNGFFIGLSTGATVLLSQFYGAKSKQGVQDTLHTGVALSLVLGAYRPKYEASYREVLKKRAGLLDPTLDYLAAYKYGDDLIRKLATMR